MLCSVDATQRSPIVALNHIIVFANNFTSMQCPSSLALRVFHQFGSYGESLGASSEEGLGGWRIQRLDDADIVILKQTKTEDHRWVPLLQTVTTNMHQSTYPRWIANRIIAMAITKPPQIHNYSPVFISSPNCNDYFDSFALRWGTKTIKCNKIKLTFK